VGRMIARKDEPTTCGAGDIDRDVCALDALNPAEEHQRGIVWNRGHKSKLGWVDEIGYTTPSAAGSRTLLADEATATGEVKTAASQLSCEADLPTARVPLVRHYFRQSLGKEWKQIGEAGETVEYLRLEDPDGPPQRESVAQGIRPRK